MTRVILPARKLICLNSVDDPTIISGDTTAYLTEDSFVSGDLNASDNDGLSDGYFSINSNPTNGTASIDPATGAWSYSPSANFYGSDSFTVIITDDQIYSTSQIISLTVTPIDDQTIVTGEFSGKLYLDHNVSGDINASDIDGLTDGSYFSIFNESCKRLRSILFPVNGTIPQIQDSWVMIPSPFKSPTIKVIPPTNPSPSFRSIMWPWRKQDNQRFWIMAMHYSRLPSFTTVDYPFSRLVFWSAHLLHSPKAPDSRIPRTKLIHFLLRV